jgi:hypothetical protein
VEEVVVEVTKVDKTTELFHTMANACLNMGNFILEENDLKNILATRAKEKAVL